MDAKVLRYFVVLIDTKSYSKAAKELYLTPQGVQSAIKRLESQLEVSLVEQHSGGVWPTEYGEILYRHAHQIVYETDACVNEIKSRVRLNSGSLLLGVSTGLTNVISRESIIAFNTETQTNAQVDVMRTMVDYDCESALRAGMCDFALLNNPIDLAHFTMVPLHADTMFLWVPESHPLSEKESVCVNELSELHIVCLTPNEFATSKRNIPVLLDSGCRLIFADEMIEVLERSMKLGICGLTVRSHINAFAHEGYVGVPIQDMTWGFGLAYKSDRVFAKYDKEFIEHMKSLASFYV